MPGSAPIKRGMPRKRSVRLLERRETPRRSVLYPAYLLFMRRRFRCRLVDIGTSGICLTGAPVLQPGTPVMVEPMLLGRSEEHTSELQSLMRISYAGFCLKQTTDS